MAAFENDQGTQSMETNGGWRKVMPSNETMHGTSPARSAGLGNVTMSSARSQPQRPNMRPSVDKTARSNDDGFIPGASLAPQLASLGKAPIGNTAAPMNGVADRKSGRESSKDDQQNFEDVTPPGSNPHESLVPKPLAVGRSKTSGRQRVHEKSVESGWWGALDSVISRPQAEYDPSNVL